MKETPLSSWLRVVPAACFGPACAAVLAACSGGTTVLLELPDVAIADVAETAARTDATPDPGGRFETSTPVDVPDLAGEHSSACRGPGCFGDPCESGADCISGVCVEHMGNLVCTDFCIEECPDGWLCKMTYLLGPDPVALCISQRSHLCVPCGESSDCSMSYVQNVCILYPGLGAFCGASCDSEHPCPDGYLCQDAMSTEGTVTKQCVAADGECDCTDWAIKLAMGTACEQVSEFGTCTGRRVCTQEGLAPCDAGIPKAETCNGLDDDCDEDYDEGSCDDGNSCTDDLCNPEKGCEHAPLDATPCDDSDKCTTGDMCDEGTCSGSAVTCNDGNPCTDDLCDAVSGCAFPNNKMPCDDDDPCTLADQCQEGTCTPGPKVTCNDGNPCTKDLCDADKGCLYQPVDGPCDDLNPCTTGDFCSLGKCTFKALDDCNDGNLCTTDACDPTQGCTHVPNALPCDDSSLCTLGDKCAGGECQPGKALACGDGNPCTDDSCNPLLGCMHVNNTASCDDLDPCTQEDVCASGSCVGSGAVGCDDGNPCSDDFCVPMAGCSHQANTAPCNDGSVCTVADQCKGGLCIPGAALTCDDGNICTKDSCDKAKGCQFLPADGPCDDANACTQDDHCAQGKCVSLSPVQCDDKNSCTTDICLPDGGCKSVPNQAACDDGNLCTTGDKCSGGKCVPGIPVQCDDGNVCTLDSCDAGICKHAPAQGACDDSNLCTKGDSCANGVCAPGLAVNCDDDNICSTDFCDPAKGCVHLHNTAPCDDGDVCTLSDKCANGVCKPASSLKCDDANPCTDDSCNPAQGCVFSPNAAQCNDQNACTTGDACTAGACVGKALVDCNDGNPCTVDSCVPATGCKHLPLDIPCDDGNACTNGDACVNGTCTPGPALACDDFNACTEDACDPKSGCTHTNRPDGTACDDGSKCTLTDQCASGKCTGSNPPDCNDGNPCTSDTCEPGIGCVNTPVQNGTLCNDLDACTQTDQCAAGKCVGSNPPDCNDNKPCTTDSCDKTKGCVHAPIAPCCGNSIVEAGEQCDDGNNKGGDGCSATCQNESPCPVGTAYVHNYCWVKAIAWEETHSAACARIGKPQTPYSVNVPWDNTVLTQVAAAWGFTSIGKYECCAHAMWCNNGTKQCGTHNFGSPFENYQKYGDSNWWPVYTCVP